MAQSTENFPLKSSIQSQFARIYEATQCNTQECLASFFKIKQSSISDAKRRGNIPDAWLIKLLSKKNINPEWIKYGIKPKHIKNDSSLQNKTQNSNFTRKKPDRVVIESILATIATEDILEELKRRQKDFIY